MREPQEKIIAGHTISVVPLPAMRACKLTPMAMRGIKALSEDEMEHYVKAVLAGARCDGKEILSATFDLDWQGRADELMAVIAFAAGVNWPSFFGGPATAPEAPPSAA